MKNRFLIVALIVGGGVVWLSLRFLVGGDGANPTISPVISPTVVEQKTLGAPIAEAVKRITKKPFGIYISTDNSPVNPEKFTGYHTGVDFEIFPGEENTDVVVNAICSGLLIEKATVSGYGGVVVQECDLNNQSITIIYGHIKLSSVSAKAGQQIVKGEKLAILGEGFSQETGGERKHLHISIHKGSSVNLRGYVQSKNELIDWINLADYL